MVHPEIQEESITITLFAPFLSVPFMSTSEDHLEVPCEQIITKVLDLLRKLTQDNVNEPKKSKTKRSYPEKVSSSTVKDYEDYLYSKILPWH